MANRLKNETSPYLLQHANNPVDWFPWGEEALQQAREADKPILLSIGYSACHWCHVMERESFEDPETAKLMNQNFVSIKVDREERPDLDSIYMQAVQALTGHGGWPMTVFLTPQGEPFYGGTYFPPQDQGGMPGFRRVLTTMADIYQNRRQEVAQSASQMVERLQNMSRMKSTADAIPPDTIGDAYTALTDAFDSTDGGFGAPPKFPQPMVYDFLLRYHHATGKSQALHMVQFSLEKMARGGMYDQLGGGFHRYSTDGQWLVPHFEKMLYDNALLSRLFLHAYQVTQRQEFRHVAEETFDYVLREMTSEEGGFFSSQDADSEGVEGKFFVWTPREIEEVLGNSDAALFNAYFDVTPGGNFEGQSILNVPLDAPTVASKAKVTEERLAQAIQRGKGSLLEVRRARVAPGRDDKVLTAWNALMLKSLAEAAATLHRSDYAEAAQANGRFLLQNLTRDGRLLRTYKDGRASLLAYLEDYSFLADALLSLYELTFDSHWIEETRRLANDMTDLFWEEDEGVFYDTGRDHEALLVRPREFFDNAIPCGSSVAVDLLLRLALLTGEEEYRRVASKAINSMGPLLSQYPMGMGRWLSALDFYQSQPKEIALIGPSRDPATRALREVITGKYLPNKVVAASPDEDPMGSHSLPLLRFRTLVQGKPTAYVCQNYVCKLPVTQPHDLVSQLEA